MKDYALEFKEFIKQQIEITKTNADNPKWDCWGFLYLAYKLENKSKGKEEWK